MVVQMQGDEAELGGFKGRTNKLVDGCYSWWVGGVFNLLKHFSPVDEGRDAEVTKDVNTEEDIWADDLDDSLSNRQALQEYILIAGQNPNGGLRDKPSKSADAYHTLYCLAGLSGSQHRVSPSVTRRSEIRQAWTGMADTAAEKLRQNVFFDVLSWVEEEGMSTVVGGSANRVNATHPLCNLTMTHTLGIMNHFYGQNVPAFVPKSMRTSAA